MSLKIPEKIDKEFKKNKSKNTYTTYVCMLGKLFKEEFDTRDFSIEKLKQFDKVKEYLDTISLTSKKLITIAIVMILKAGECDKTTIDFYGKLARQYRIGR